MTPHKEEFGVEPGCEQLNMAPSIYDAVKNRPQSKRAVGNAALGAKVTVLHEASFGVYGARDVWLLLRREGTAVARCTVERLMRELGLAGALRGVVKRTTRPGDVAQRPRDLVERDVMALAPARLWVADLE